MKSKIKKSGMYDLIMTHDNEFKLVLRSLNHVTRSIGTIDNKLVSRG